MSMHEPTPAGCRGCGGDARLGAGAARRPASRPAARDARTALPELTAGGIGTEAAMRLLLDVIVPTAIPPDHPRYPGLRPGRADRRGDDRRHGPLGGDDLRRQPHRGRRSRPTPRTPCSAGWPTPPASRRRPTARSSAAARSPTSAPWSPPAATATPRHGGRSSSPAPRRTRPWRPRRGSWAATSCAAPPADEHGRLTGATLAAALEGRDAGDVVAVVATAGATNNGAVDDLAGVAGVCADRGIWLHVDGAYGGAALLSPRARPPLRRHRARRLVHRRPAQVAVHAVRLRRRAVPRRRGGPSGAHAGGRLP